MPAPDPADVAALVEEARRAGRADALVQLRELWRDAYLSAATAPATEVDGAAWWVYCIVDDSARIPADLTGVADAPVEIVRAHGLAAVAGAVPAAEFNDERLREHLEDLAWVEHVARAHERVLEAVMERAAIVPLRLCTICLTRERVGELLAEQAAALGAALDRLRGHTEWGLKLFAPAPGAPPPAAEDADGAGYLERKRRLRAQREEAQQQATDRARRLHEALSERAVACTVNPPQQREAHGRDADMLLNAAYLVDDEHAGQLQAVMSEFEVELRPHGYEVELTGPWPPYNFVTAEAVTP
jgi:hypothetical protein